MSKKKISVSMFVVIIVLTVLFIHPSQAIEFELGGEPAAITGYVNQGLGFGISGEHYDTKKGFQSAIFQFLLEAGYEPHNDLKFFVSGNFNADWAYPILSHNNKWEKKKFDKSRHELFILDNWQDVLKECHVTWTPGDFFFRMGKQIAVWGETDGFRLIDQVNPLDQRRGLSDVEFESTVIPIWLLRAEYFPKIKSTWLQDLGLQFIFNPNAKFRGNENIVPGNDLAGIWAPNINIPLLGPYPFDYAHLGSLNQNLKEPGTFHHEGFEYGFRLKSVLYNTIVTLNYFYGRDNDPVTKNVMAPPIIETSPYDGRFVFHPFTEGYYPRFRFVGATLSKDLDFLKASFLGGVSPVLRFETFWAFNNTFVTETNMFDKSDELRWAIGADWKVKIPFLNARAYFTISPQFYHRRITDYPSAKYQNLKKDNYTTTLMVNTTYLHNKLQPFFFWMRDITNKANFFKIQLSYEQSHHWIYTLGTLFFDGRKEGKGFEPLEHKDQVYFTVSYRF